MTTRPCCLPSGLALAAFIAFLFGLPVPSAYSQQGQAPSSVRDLTFGGISLGMSRNDLMTLWETAPIKRVDSTCESGGCVCRGMWVVSPTPEEAKTLVEAQKLFPAGLQCGAVIATFTFDTVTTFSMLSRSWTQSDAAEITKAYQTLLGMMSQQYGHPAEVSVSGNFGAKHFTAAKRESLTLASWEWQVGDDFLMVMIELETAAAGRFCLSLSMIALNEMTERGEACQR